MDNSQLLLARIITACILFQFSAEAACHKDRQGAADEQGLVMKAHAELKKLQGSGPPGAIGQTINKLYAKATRAELAELAIQRDDNVALQAAWELFLRARNAPTSESCILEAGRFLGRVEGRMGVIVPVWWAVAFQEYHAKLSRASFGRLLEQYKRDYSSLLVKTRTGNLLFSPLPMKRTEIIGAWIPSATRMIDQGETVLLREKGRSYKVSKGLFHDLKDKVHLPITQYRFLLGDLDSFILGCTTVGSGYNILKVNTATGKAVWTQRVWGVGTDSPGPRSGPWSHDCEIIRTPNLVAVFGAVNLDILYVEVFDNKTGKPLLRFATNRWIIK